MILDVRVTYQEYIKDAMASPWFKWISKIAFAEGSSTVHINPHTANQFETLPN